MVPYQTCVELFSEHNTDGHNVVFFTFLKCPETQNAFPKYVARQQNGYVLLMKFEIEHNM